MPANSYNARARNCLLAVTMFASGWVLLPATAPAQNSGPWQMQHSGTTAGLRGIHAVGGGVAWASGTGGTVLRTEDSGFVWQTCAVPPGAEKLDFRGIWAWDAQTAIVMSSGPGDQSRLYKTTDGCGTWKLLFTNPDASAHAGFWDALLFVDRQRGIIAGDPVESNAANPVEGGYRAFRIRVTNDGGRTWDPVVAPAGPSKPGTYLYPLASEGLFAASNSSIAISPSGFWIGISGGRLLHIARDKAFFQYGGCAGAVDPWSKRCGIPWMDWQSTQAPLAHGNDSSGIFSLDFRDAIHGIAAGGDYQKPGESSGTAAWTADGGKTWTAAAKPPHGYRSTVAWDAGAKAWITAGTNGSDVSYDDGKTWQPLDDGKWNAISLPWIVGPDGRIAKLGALPKPR
jgi:photosystem II stability/assembly factor-like uncharacterized protein